MVPSLLDSVEALVTSYGSPLYVYDAADVRASYRAFVAAFPYQPFDCHYAIVCNKNPYLVAALAALGAGIHANTPGDAFAALAAGVPANRIVYSGTNLHADDFDFLLARGIPLNLDSLDQLRDLSARPDRPPTVGLRLLVDAPNAESRIGLAPDELEAAVGLAAEAGMRVVTLHMYAGTNTRRVERFEACLDRLIAASAALPDLEAIDIGGGFGVSYRDGHAPIALDTLGARVASRMTTLSEARGRPIRLVAEPGRLLVASSGALVMTVVSLKTRHGRRFVGVDSTVGNLVVPSVYHPYHRVLAAAPRGPLLDVPTDVCGNTTHSRDFLGRDLRLPELRPGDRLALLDVGAYGYAMSSHFLNRPRPAEVVLDGEQVLLTTRRERFEDLLATVNRA